MKAPDYTQRDAHMAEAARQLIPLAEAGDAAAARECIAAAILIVKPRAPELAAYLERELESAIKLAHSAGAKVKVGFRLKRGRGRPAASGLSPMWEREREDFVFEKVRESMAQGLSVEQAFQEYVDAWDREYIEEQFGSRVPKKLTADQEERWRIERDREARLVELRYASALRRSRRAAANE